MLTPFRDRVEAGRELAKKLVKYAGHPAVLVLALPRGGVPVAFEVARALQAPLDVFLVRKLGVPGNEELAMGAIASGGVWVLNEDIIQALKPPFRVIQAVAARELQELERRERLYRGERRAVEVHGRIVILVDDGLATGSTMRAAVAALRRLGPERVIVAAPTAAPATCAELGDEVDECICAITPDPFYAVGLWYEDFSQTTDDQVRDLLVRAGAGTIAATAERSGAAAMNTGTGLDLSHDLAVEAVQKAAHPLLGADDNYDPLLADRETQDRQNGFDINLLTERLGSAIDWLSRDPATRGQRTHSRPTTFNQRGELP